MDRDDSSLLPGSLPPLLLIQKFVKKDSFGKSLGVSAVLGVLAAIPTPITGTAVGAIALGSPDSGRSRKR